MTLDFIIGDDTHIDAYNAGGVCGCLPRREPVGGLDCASVNTEELIPWDAMPDMIADEERDKSSLFDIWQDSKIGVLNQNPLSFCWAFSSVEALMLERELMGLPYVSLSPSSVACPITGYQDKGWYTADALKWMVKNGVASTDYVPATTTNAAKFKLGWKESAACYKVTEWDDVGREAQRQNSKLLTKKPLVAEHVWWKHAILHLKLLDRYPRLPANNPLRYGRKFLQSWGPSYGVKGCGILEGQRAIADQAYAVKQASFAG